MKYLSVSLLLLTCLLSVVSAYGQSCSNQLYTGAYIEDAIANPEDPTVGSVYLVLPNRAGAYRGDLFFTFAGCQSRNVGEVVGVRTNNTLSGQWSGVIDGTDQRGMFSGSLVGANSFEGDYTVDDGKQTIEVENCREYIISPFGTWFVLPVNEARDDDQLLAFSNQRVVWEPVLNAIVTQCGLIEVDSGNCHESTETVWQGTTFAFEAFIQIPSQVFSSNREYLLSCSQFDEQRNRLAFSNHSFVYEPTLVESESPTTAVLPSIHDLLLND